MSHSFSMASGEEDGKRYHIRPFHLTLQGHLEVIFCCHHQRIRANQGGIFPTKISFSDLVVFIHKALTEL